MKIKEQKIKGIYLLKPDIYKDNRGFFFESYNCKKLQNILGRKKFVQSNHSYSKKNVLRGIHFQKSKPQFQLFYLIKGELDIFFVDLRPNSITFKKNIFLNLKSETKFQLLTCPGIGTAFHTKKNENIVIYYVSEIYNPKNELGIMWNDKSLKLNWKCKKPIISKKDLSNKNFNDINFRKFKDLQNLI